MAVERMMKILMYLGFGALALVGYQYWQATKEGSGSLYWSSANPWVYGIGGMALIYFGGRK
jgi:hypothetical protein